MSRHSNHGRVALKVLAMGVICGVALYPLIAAAATPGAGERHAIPIAVGSSAPATLSPVSGSSKDYWSVFSVHLSAGQTLEATCTYSPSITSPDMHAWASFRTDIAALHSRWVSPTQRIIRVLAPKPGTYYLAVFGQSVAGTVTVETTSAPAVDYSMSSVIAPKAASHLKTFKVAIILTGAFDELIVPVRFAVSRKTSAGWAGATSVQPLAGSLGDPMHVVFSKNMKLARGTYRIRARFSDAAHPVRTYTAWKTVRVN